MRSSGITVASFYTHSTRRNPRDSSSTNSTSRRQGALRFILHTEGKEIFYPVYRNSTRTFQALLHVPAPSSINQYLPVLSSVSRDSIHSSISLIRMQILHTDWFPPENSFEYQLGHSTNITFFKEREML